MAIHPSILAWRIPWTEETDGLQSMGSQRVRHNLVTEQQQETVRTQIRSTARSIRWSRIHTGVVGFSFPPILLYVFMDYKAVDLPDSWLGSSGATVQT